MLEKIKNGILKIKSTKKGPTCTLIACTHGDELIGYYIFEYLVNNFDIQNKILQGNLNLVIGNLKAMQGKKRFIDIDFNRIWNFKEEFKKTYEYKRAKQIKNIIANSDYVFDLHSATNPSPFFLIPEGKIDNNLLKGFDIDFIVKDILDFLHGKPLIKYVYEQNPKSKTLVMEGYIKDNTDIKKAIRNILYYLNYHGFIKYNIEDKKNNSIILDTKKAIYAKSMNINFLYTNKPESFQKIKKGEKILEDNGKILISDNNYYILMPTKPRYIGEEIGYLLK